MTSDHPDTSQDQARSPQAGFVELSKRVQRIVAITQVNGVFQLHGAMPEDGAMQAVIEEREPDFDIDGRELSAMIGFGFSATDASGKKIIDVAATFHVHYELNIDDFVYNDDDLKMFSEINGRFNTVSYWREFLNSCLSRAGLPPYPVSPFNAQKRIKNYAPKSPDEE